VQEEEQNEEDEEEGEMEEDEAGDGVEGEDERGDGIDDVDEVDMELHSWVEHELKPVIIASGLSPLCLLIAGAFWLKPLDLCFFVRIGTHPHPEIRAHTD